jgi:hypothetical protein
MSDSLENAILTGGGNCATAPTKLANRASGLNLVVAAIALWNTVYLERAINALQERSYVIDQKLLAHLSPLKWDHINLTGDHHWRRDGGLKSQAQTASEPTASSEICFLATVLDVKRRVERLIGVLEIEPPSAVEFGTLQYSGERKRRAGLGLSVPFEGNRGLNARAERGPPLVLVPNQSVQYDKQLPHARNKGHFGRFACPLETLIEAAD